LTVENHYWITLLNNHGASDLNSADLNHILLVQRPTV